MENQKIELTEREKEIIFVSLLEFRDFHYTKNEIYNLIDKIKNIETPRKQIDVKEDP